MKVIGITGGTGSGKSTIAGLLNKKGINVIDADIIARQILNKGEKAYNEVIESFGHKVLNKSGEIDRKVLGSLVFHDQTKLKLISDITHKYVADKIAAMLEAERANGRSSIVALDVPIPVEHGFIDVSDEIWVVTAPLEIRLNRIMKRNGLTREEALDRINSQMNEDEYLRLADKVIVNDGSAKGLSDRINELLNEES